MTRQALYNRLIKIAPVIQLAKLKGRVRDDIICLIRNRPTLSISNDVCGWESYDITIIVPDDSIMRLDILYNKVHDMLTTIPEVELVYDGFISEAHDPTLEAYYTTLQIRFPSQLIK